MKTLTSAAAVLMLSWPASATDIITIDVAESEAFGQYLTDSAARPLYVFSNDTRATEDKPAKISCTSADCLDAWRMVITSGDPQAAEGVDVLRLGTVEHNHRQVVTYDGWPLYYSARDDGSKPLLTANVEAFDGEWTLLGPDTTTGTADISSGEAMYADACAQCHGRTARGMASFPSLIGREAGYIADKLKLYRAGETVGPNSALMRPVAAKLSDEDIRNLAAFVSEAFD